MNSEFKELQKENDKIRKKINHLLDYPEEEFKEKVFSLIEELINNECEQEKFCGE